MPTVGEPVGLLLALTYTEYVPPPSGDPEIGNPIGLLLALTYSDGSVAPTPSPIGSDTYYYSPSRQNIQNILDVLYRKRRKRKGITKAKRLEQMAEELLNEFEPGPDLPPLDLTALKRAIAMLDEPIRISRAAPEETRRQVVEALYNQAYKSQAELIEEDDDEVLEMALRAMLN